jgi:hypothetical protein
MRDPTPEFSSLSRDELRSISQTLTGTPARMDKLRPRLEHIESLLAQAGKLPDKPVLVWREADGSRRHAVIGAKLVVGRHPDKADLALAGDKLLSRRHFVIRASGEDCELEDLNSRNGTMVNDPRNRVQRQWLLDGDLILAGNHIFAFLCQRGAG